MRSLGRTLKRLSIVVLVLGVLLDIYVVYYAITDGGLARMYIYNFMPSFPDSLSILFDIVILVMILLIIPILSLVIYGVGTRTEQIYEYKNLLKQVSENTEGK